MLSSGQLNWEPMTARMAQRKIGNVISSKILPDVSSTMPTKTELKKLTVTSCLKDIDKSVNSSQCPELNYTSFDEIPSREYIVDSGASFHLVNITDLTRQEMKTKRKIRPIHLQTANGIVTVDHKVRVFVHTLGIYVWAILHRNTPNLLSQGSLVKDDKFSYIHKHGKTPYLEKDGRKYYCPIRENTPTIVGAHDLTSDEIDMTSEPDSGNR